jgi:hypothetical protein
VSDEERLRTHGLRVCRELCAEKGFSAGAFRDCVERCLEEMVKERHPEGSILSKELT